MPNVRSPVPTTAGTGSETTGAAIVDITSRAFKTGIANRALKPRLGIVDTLNTRTCSRGVSIVFSEHVFLDAITSLYLPRASYQCRT